MHGVAKDVLYDIDYKPCGRNCRKVTFPQTVLPSSFAESDLFPVGLPYRFPILNACGFTSVGLQSAVCQPRKSWIKLTLQSSPHTTSERRCMDVVLTFSRRINVHATSFAGKGVFATSMLVIGT